MEKGWKATGLLAPLWRRYEGGRDALAVAVGTTGTVLSSINTGKRNLGRDLARRLASELGVSVIELGGPEEEDDREADRLRDRLARVEAQAAANTTAIDALQEALRALLPALEAMGVRVDGIPGDALPPEAGGSRA